MIGVQAVGIVRRDHEARGQHPQIVLLAPAQGRVDPVQDIPQEGARRALLRAAPDLLIVQHAVHRDAPCRLCRKNPPEGCKGTLQVVQPPARDEFPVQADICSLHAVVEVKVRVQDLVRMHPGLLCDQSLKLAGLSILTGLFISTRFRTIPHRGFCRL